MFKKTKSTLEFDRIKDTTDLYKITVSNISKKNKEGGCDPEKLAAALATLGQVLFNRRTSQSTFQILLQRSMSWSCWWRSQPFEGLSLQKTLIQYVKHYPVSLPPVHRRRKQSKKRDKILKKTNLTEDQSSDDEALPDLSWSIQGRTYQCVADDVTDWQNELNVFRFERDGKKIFFCFSAAVIKYIKDNNCNNHYLAKMVKTALEKRTFVSSRGNAGVVYCRKEALKSPVSALNQCWYKTKDPNCADRIWASKFFDTDESLPPLYQFSQATKGKNPYKPQIKIATNGRSSPSI